MTASNCFLLLLEWNFSTGNPFFPPLSCAHDSQSFDETHHQMSGFYIPQHFFMADGKTNFRHFPPPFFLPLSTAMRLAVAARFIGDRKRAKNTCSEMVNEVEHGENLNAI